MPTPSLLFTANGTAQMTLAAAYTPGSGSVTLTASPPFSASAAAPVAVSLIKKSTYAQASAEVSTIYWCTAVSGATLTLSGIEYGIDQAFAVGDYAEARPSAGAVNGPTAILSFSGSTTGQVLTSNGASSVPTWQDATASGGTVTTVSVADANGFNGSVATPTTTPVITLSTTVTGVVKGNGTSLEEAAAGTDYQAPLTLTTTGSTGAATFNGTTLNIPEYTSNAGTVTSVSVVSANGLGGTVATSTSTPAITLTTSITGVLKGNGTAIAAATADTDYQSPITLTTTGTSGPATFSGNTLNIPEYPVGTVTSVGLTVPSGLTITGSPITTSGTLAIGGTLAASAGGTGISAGTASNGQLLIGNGSGFSLANLAAGANVVITNSAGGITITSNGGTAAPGGTSGQLQYNNSGALGGTSNVTFDSNGLLSLTPVSPPGSPSDGEVFSNSTQGGLSTYQSGVLANLGGTVGWTTAAGTAIVDTTTRTSLFAGSTQVGLWTIPTTWWQVGRVIRLSTNGLITNTANGTFSFLGIVFGTTSSTEHTSIGGGSSASNATYWQSVCELTCQTTGTGGTVTVSGSVGFGLSGTAPTSFFHNPATSPSIPVNTTISNAIDQQMSWTAASSNSSIQLLNGRLELLN